MGKLILAFDPGASVGFAALSSDGRLTVTRTIWANDLDAFLQHLRVKLFPAEYDVVVEKSPEFQHHSPVTKRVEAILVEEYPEAHLVQPSQWKNHPVSRRKLQGQLTQHERDAAHLALWFQSRRDSAHQAADATGADAGSSRR